MPDRPTTSGVQELIDRLSHEGVVAGERRAEQLVEEARKKADEIVDAARRQAEALLVQARQEAEQQKAAGEEALRLACRDAVRDLQSQIHGDVRNRLRRLVTHTLQDNDFLNRLILQIAAKAMPGEDAELEILLPDSIELDESLRQRIDRGETDALTDFVKRMMGDALREGIAFRTTEDGQVGLRIRELNRDIEIDLTDDAITNLLIGHLLPRFRAVMRQSL